MRKLKLVNNREKVYLDYIDDYFLITSPNDWNILVNFTDAYLVFEIPGFSILERNVKTEVNRKFIDYQNYKLMNNLDFTDISFNTWKYFNGELDGNNKSIKNSNIIFGEINRANIKNLVIINNNLLAETIHLSQLDNITLNYSLSETFSGEINNLIINGYLDKPICNIYNGEIKNSNLNNNSKEINLFNIFKGKINNCSFNNLLIENNNIYNSKVFKNLELYMVFDNDGNIENKKIYTDDLFITVYENTGLTISNQNTEDNTELTSKENTELTSKENTEISKEIKQNKNINLLKLRRR